MKTKRHTRQGFTLLEVVIVVVVIGILTALAVPALGTFVARQQVRNSARGFADALLLARSEAMRSGVNHVVLMRIGAAGTADPRGNLIVDDQGDPTDMIILQDDDGDCSLDAGEPRNFYNFEPNVNWGVGVATAKAPLDGTLPAANGGSTFIDPTVPAANTRWLLFGPDGVPLSFSGSLATGCGTMGRVGTGNGALYVTDGVRDYSVVLTPLGGLRLHAWDGQAAAWSQ